jgi:hypothetical protein
VWILTGESNRKSETLLGPGIGGEQPAGSLLFAQAIRRAGWLLFLGG